MKIIRSLKLRDDLNETALYIADDNPDAADKFLLACDATFERIRQMPHIGRVFLPEKLKDVRLWFVKDFPKYVILYKILDDAVYIVRVIHSSRDIEAVLTIN